MTSHRWHNSDTASSCPGFVRNHSEYLDSACFLKLSAVTSTFLVINGNFAFKALKRKFAYKEAATSFTNGSGVDVAIVEILVLK